MKLAFIVITIIINFFNPSNIKSEEKIDLKNNKIETIENEDSRADKKSKIKKIHIVKKGDTISRISEFYSINKKSIIKMNNLKDENYIYIGQNLIISNANENSIKEANRYHIVQTGDNLTEISNKYKLKLEYLIEINNLINPDSLEVGEKLLLRKDIPNIEENRKRIEDERNKELFHLDKKTYGPITIQSKSFEKKNGRKVLNVLNQNNEKLILSINCETQELDVRIPGRKWSGWKPAKEEFEKKLINDLCKNF